MLGKGVIVVGYLFLRFLNCEIDDKNVFDEKELLVMEELFFFFLFWYCWLKVFVMCKKFVLEELLLEMV